MQSQSLSAELAVSKLKTATVRFGIGSKIIIINYMSLW